MYAAAVLTLKRAGFEHYEVSNYAKQGHRSRHNQVSMPCVQQLQPTVASVQKCLVWVIGGASLTLPLHMPLCEGAKVCTRCPAST
jgi:hypothetical protein